MKIAFEGEETKGDLDAISNLIMWIYQTTDVEKLEQMLNLAMSAGGNALPAPADTKEDKPEADKKDSKITDVPSTGAANIPGSEGNNIQVAVLNKQIEELFDKNNQLEEEKKLTDEEIAQLNQEIYKLNDKILQMQVSGTVSTPTKGPGAEDSSKDLSYSLTHDKVEIESMQRFFELKDSNVKRQADLHKLRCKLENL